MIRVGSIWESFDLRFVVIGVVEREGHIWIHYRNAKTAQEYSCYEESFVARYKEVLNDSHRKI